MNSVMAWGVLARPHLPVPCILQRVHPVTQLQYEGLIRTTPPVGGQASRQARKQASQQASTITRLQLYV